MANSQLTPIRLSIILPVRNDGANLRTVVRVISVLVETAYEVLVVHDAPDDDSVAIVPVLQKAFGNISRVHNTRGTGVLNAVRAGVEAARGEFVMILAADDIGPIVIIDRLVAIMGQGCDFLGLTRYSKGGKCFGGSVVARILSRIANRAFRILTSSAFTDCTFGLKMFRREVFSRFVFSPDQAGWSFAFEMSILAQIMGLRIAEYPVISLNRIFEEGKSTFNAGTWIKSYLRRFSFGLQHLPKWRSPRPKLIEIPGIGR